MTARARIILLSVLCLALLASSFSAAVAAAADRIEKGNLVIEGIPEIPDGVMDRLVQYQNTRSASLSGWLPDGSGILIGTRFGDTTQVHHVARPGGDRRQITFFKEPVAGASISPNPETHGFIYQRDVGGSEFYQLYFMDMKTGESSLLTDGKSRNGEASWANDGRRFVFYTTRRNGRDWDIHLADVRNPGTSTPLLEKEGAWVAGEWSPDDTKIIVLRLVSASETYPYVLDVSTRALTQINPKKEKISYAAAAWARDGKGIYFASDEATEFKHLRHYDLASGKMTVLTADIPWDIEGVAVSRDGRFLAFTANEDGIARLHVRTLPDMKEMALPDLPMGLVSGISFSPDSRKMGLVLNTPRTPGDVFALDLGTRTLERWTQSEVGGLNSDGFGVPELIRYETFDKVSGKPRTIPAFYYKPEGPGPHPVVINIHGGPEGQSRPGFSALTQYYLKELGVAVILPNVRGSTGYGKGYLELDNGFKREDSVKDIGGLLDWIGARPELDKDRVAVTGGSYGGYMVLASMTHYNDRLRAGVDTVGISNFITFLETTQDYRQDLRRVEYGDERDPEMRAHLEKISPKTNATRITKPMLIIQGLNDPRVPVTESEQMVQTIRGNGGNVWYLMAKDEGHGFRKKVNRDYAEAATSLFLEAFLLSAPIAQGN